MFYSLAVRYAIPWDQEYFQAKFFVVWGVKKA